MSLVSRLAVACVLSAAMLAVATSADANTFRTLHRFTGGADGSTPYADLVLDKTGVLYGTTSYGGVGDCSGEGGCGTVFKLNPTTHVLTTLHRFTGGADGGVPFGGLVLDKTGALYGTTEFGGVYNAGTVFKLNPTTHVLTTLHRFTGGAGGGVPNGHLVFDQTGVLYGTTFEGGDFSCVEGEGMGCGTVFKLNPTTRALTTLHRFTGGADGYFPYAGLVFDKAGALYGTTPYGGKRVCNNLANYCGTVFKLNPITRVFTTLHRFTGGADGAVPFSGVAFDAKTGVLYGTTSGGGGLGTVFKLDPSTHVLTTLHAFTGGADGGGSSGNLVLDAAGALYGTTLGGGVDDQGTVFKLNPTTHVLTTLHKFTGGAEGAYPSYAGLVFDPTGALYGTTPYGGVKKVCGGVPGCGTVFKLIP